VTCGVVRADNRVELTASMVERSVLRYTPAGIPICQCILQHASTQVEARQARQIEMQMAAVGLGELAVRLDQLLLGQPYRFTGFLAQTRRNSRNVIYHITEFNLEIED
jgi:primosomal replication protein N